MELATTLLRIWRLRLWIVLGVFLAGGAAAVSLTMLGTKAYSSASTQMVVDAPHSALGDSKENLSPFLTRAVVYARLMTSPQALQYIGKAAGIPGNLIAASGPEELGAPQATHAPTAPQGTDLHSTAGYKLNFLQNPELPTVDVYAQAPSTGQAIALANGAVTGFAAYLHNLDTQSSVPASQRVTIRQAGAATGGVVDPGVSKSLAALIFVGVLALWCALVLFASNLRAQLRLARMSRESQDGQTDSLLDAVAPRVDVSHAGAESDEPFSEDDLRDYALDGALSSNGAGDPGELRERRWVPSAADEAGGAAGNADRP